MVITFGGPKGGAGKSTLAQNTAIEFLQAGASPALIDMDRNQTSSTWAAVRGKNEGVRQLPVFRIQNTGEALKDEILQLTSKHHPVVIDVEGGDSVNFRSALAASTIALFPLEPTRSNVQTIGQLWKVVGQVRKQFNPNLKAFILINRSPTHPSVRRKTTEKLSRQLLVREEQLRAGSKPVVVPFSKVVIHERFAFKKSDFTGLGVQELELKDPKAIREIQSLYNFICNA